MPAIKVTNKTGWDISFLRPYAEKLRPFIQLVDGKDFPFEIIVVKKKDFYDRSNFDLDSHQLIFKIDPKKQSKEDIAWVLIHEFCHFLCSTNPELKKTSLSEEHFTLKKILQKNFKIKTEEIEEIFHDFLPAEVVANFFATLIIGKFHKRHPFSNVEKQIRKSNHG